MAARGLRYFGALVLVAAITPFPFLAALITIIVYLSPSPRPAVTFFTWLGPSSMVILLGLIITLVLWLLLAIPCMRFATAKGARPSDYESLQREVTALKNRFEVVKGKDEETQDTAGEHQNARAIAISDVEAAVDDIKARLGSNGLPWVSYTGYVSLWGRFNRADEAIIDVLPCETVIESANYEELRLENSEVPECEKLLTCLKEARTTLSSDLKRSKQSSEQNQDTNSQQSTAQAMPVLLKRLCVKEASLHLESDLTGYISFLPGSLVKRSQTTLHTTSSKKTFDPPSPSTTINGQGSQQSVQEARAAIRRVKAALHNFTNERWDGLVRARNQLVGTAFLTAFFTYMLAIIAVLAKVRTMNTLDAMVFYFLGAIVGLFGRLFDERHADTVMDDYGLSMARIIVTPLISGLAALVGVLFVTTSATLDTLYQLTPQNLVFAAALGFAPNILINLLRSKSEAIKSQIKSVGPSDHKSGKGK